MATKKRMRLTFDTNKAMGMAGAIWGTGQLIKQDFYTNLNVPTNIEAIAMVFLGDWVPKQQFARNALKNDSMRNGLGSGLEAMGIINLLESFGVGNVGAMGQLRDDDILAVAIEGTDDEDYEDVSDYMEDEEDISFVDGDDDDIDVVNEDVLGDDDDLDVVNEDVLGDDDDAYEEDVVDDFM